MKLILLMELASLLIISCDENSLSSNKYEAEDTETFFISLSNQVLFILENTNGNVTISASDTANNIYCDVVKKVTSDESEDDARAHIQDINIDITKNSSEARLVVDHPNNTQRNYTINMDIIIPNNFNHTLTLGNGNFDLKTRTKILILNVGNGNVNTDISLMDSCNAAITIGNGNLNFTIPGITNADLSASVGNGVISNNGLNFQNQQLINNQFSGTLGDGSGNIVLTVGNGNVNMNKK